MGLREAADLSARLTEILRKNAPLDSLGQYGREYAVQWRHLLGIDEGLTPTEGAQPWASRYCSRILPCIPATGDDLKTLAAQIALDFAPGERSPDGP